MIGFLHVVHRKPLLCGIEILQRLASPLLQDSQFAGNSVRFLLLGEQLRFKSLDGRFVERFPFQ